MPCVLQDWVVDLPYMQQSVLLTSIRGPDGITKETPAKNILRWLRRCVLLSAFDGAVLSRPDIEGGGSFTGPSIKENWSGGTNCTNDEYRWQALAELVDDYFDGVDMYPHHFQMHLMHAAQIVGYKHPDEWTQRFWRRFYFHYVNSLHLSVEPESEMDRRLCDNEEAWRESEVNNAKGGHQPSS